MKIKDQSKLKSRLGRTLLYALIAVAVLAAGALPLYRALSQSNADTPGQASASLDSLPTRLHVNPDGSVRLSFQGKAGVAYQIYYSDKLPASADKTAWMLVADHVAAGSGDWTDWLDAGAATRSRPAGAKQGFYRVARKSVPTTKTDLVTPATPSSTEGAINSTVTDPQAALKAKRKREMAEFMELIAGGPEMESALAQKLAETPLTGEYILELTKSFPALEYGWARRLILEAVIGPKAGALKPKQLGRARLMLGAVYAGAQRFSDAIEQFLEVARMRPTALYGCEGWVSAGRIYRMQKNNVEARRCWEEAVQFRGLSGVGRWPEEAQWMIGLTYYEERNYARALAEFQKQVEWPESGLLKAHGYFFMGEALRGMGRWQEAYTAYRKVIELNRDLPDGSPFRPQYNVAEKWARTAWAQIASHLPPTSSQAEGEGAESTGEGQ